MCCFIGPGLFQSQRKTVRTVSLKCLVFGKSHKDDDVQWKHHERKPLKCWLFEDSYAVELKAAQRCEWCFSPHRQKATVTASGIQEQC
ncbi:hypothetical protein GN956_G20516 [Arapaima gigas]